LVAFSTNFAYFWSEIGLIFIIIKLCCEKYINVFIHNIIMLSSNVFSNGAKTVERPDVQVKNVYRNPLDQIDFPTKLKPIDEPLFVKGRVFIDKSEQNKAFIIIYLGNITSAFDTRWVRWFNKKFDILDPTKVIIRDITLHEKGHILLVKHAEEVEKVVMKQVFRTFVYSTVSPQDSIQRITNYIEDICDNFFVSYFSRMNGIVLQWFISGLRQKTFNPLFEAFVKVNLYLWGNNVQKRILERFMSNDKRVIKAVKRFIERLNLSRDREENAHVLLSQDNAQNVASAFIMMTNEIYME